MDAPDLTGLIKAEHSLRRRLSELVETQQWAHHVADLDSGELRTFPLDRPVTPLSRLERLSRLGHRFDDSIFGGPSYRLTPRSPYQASPEAYLAAFGAGSYLPWNDVVIWEFRQDLGTPPGLHGMYFVFSECPDGRSVLSFSLSGNAWPQALGHVRVWASGGPLPASIEIPIADTFAAHTVDLTFVTVGGQPSEVDMTLEAGIGLLTFNAVSFGTAPPVVYPVNLP
jgi:hypothetical protein